MFFLFTKLLYALLKPITLITISFVASFLVNNTRWKKRLRITGIVLAIVFTNHFLANKVMQAWEPDPVPFSSLPNYDVAIIMGGVTNQFMEPADRTYFRKGADRLLHPYQLYRQGKIAHFILSGGPASTLTSPTTEAETLATAMRAFGVPDSLLSLERESMNTRDEAIMCKQILDSLYEEPPKILISTSAFHIKRTRLCFEKVGVKADYLATDFYSDSRPEQLILIFPSSQALHLWEILFKEWIGIVGYKLLGHA